MSDKEEFKESLKTLGAQLAALLTEISVSEEKLNNRVKKDELQKHLRDIDRAISSAIDKVDKEFDGKLDRTKESYSSKIVLVYKKIDESIQTVNTLVSNLEKSLNKAVNALKDDLTVVKVESAKSAVITALITTIIGGAITSIIVYYVTKGGG